MSVILFFMKIIVIIICYYCNFNHQLYFIFIFYSAIRRSLKNIQLVRHNYIMMSNNVMIYFIQLTVNSSTHKRKIWAKNNNICYFVILFILEPLLGSQSKHNVPVGIIL